MRFRDLGHRRPSFLRHSGLAASQFLLGSALLGAAGIG